MKVYVLRYEDDNFFVGACGDTSKILRLKIKPSGEWVKSKTLICLEEFLDVPLDITYQKFKNYIVIKYMSKYGIEKVRGGSWTSYIISPISMSHIIPTLEKINFEDDVSVISEIYEEELSKSAVSSYSNFSRRNRGNSEPFLESFERMNISSVKIKCPLCRSSLPFLEKPKLYKGIENKCSICLDEICRIICDSCSVPITCFSCYKNLKPFK